MITQQDIKKYKEAIDKVWLPLDKSEENLIWGEMFSFFDELLVEGQVSVK